MTADWDFFDKIYCISLVERPDRRQEAKAQFARVGLAHRVEFVMVPKDPPEDCARGIFNSHMLCMRKALQAGAGHILIFEDDIVFERFAPDTLRGCTAFLEARRRWHMLFLGCMVRGSRRTDTPAVVHIRFRSLTHAYAVHHEFARFLVNQPWNGAPFDDFLRDLNDAHMYAACPAFAFQSNSRSDNTPYLPLDRVRRRLGGLRNLQKLNEFYHRNRWRVIAAHGVALLLLLILLAT
jgi:GR25 family glycosyltransferase involved in LPS biosynthesis